ncbi:N-6 DNA methylase [Micromonospora sp. NPDC126480]|uniref:HsdM family class I SAM-dependent methyltransferase n=1 Tax=Micromonospora sp. NPDC126480 TaxID=3155312 RepID=UPI00332CD41E
MGDLWRWESFVRAQSVREDATVGNERNTEAIVRSHFQADATANLLIEEQASTDPRVTKCLARASKLGKGRGKPEFVIRHPDHPALLVVVECKASLAAHESTNRGRPADFAVDGVLHYAKALSSSFDVVAVAVSGESSNRMKVSTFRHLKGAPAAELLSSNLGPVEKLIAFAEYRHLLLFDPAVRRRTLDELMAYSRTLHNFMRDYAKVSEAEKPLLVSGILLGLRDDAFRNTYQRYSPRDLAIQLYEAIKRVLSADLPTSSLAITLQPYYFIKTHPELVRPVRIKNGPTIVPLVQLTHEIDEHVRPFADTYDDVDVIGQFYGEFLRYSGGDKKSLGIVLTPRHVTELAARVANVKPTDTVVDTCAGSGGFLISAMAYMDSRVPQYDTEARRQIRENRLVGVEQQPPMFALAMSNMLLRGDGKSNLYQGSCFDPDIISKLTDGAGRHKRPTIGLINPPFAQKGEGLQELNFVETLLDILAPGGTAFCIVPMSCAIGSSAAKEAILARHTLTAVLSLPDELFYPVGTITCAMIFKAHEPHEFANTPTWFGYWKHDGFVKAKDRGRIDLYDRWPEIRDEWLRDYHGRIVAPGRSAARYVTAQDEWCAEAYMDTDYSKVGRQEFSEVVRDFALHRARGTTAPTDELSGE